MGIYIKGMEMPTNGHITITISDNGEVVCNSEVIGGKYQYRSYGRIGKAIPVPEHGRLIDADKLDYSKTDLLGNHIVYMVDIEDAPTIIPASGGNKNE